MSPLQASQGVELDYELTLSHYHTVVVAVEPLEPVVAVVLSIVVKQASWTKIDD